MDNDDEVRDRATYFRAILDKQEAALNSMYILNGMQVQEVPSSLFCLKQCCAGLRSRAILPRLQLQLRLRLLLI